MAPPRKTTLILGFWWCTARHPLRRPSPKLFHKPQSRPCSHWAQVETFLRNDWSSWLEKRDSIWTLWEQRSGLSVVSRNIVACALFPSVRFTKVHQLISIRVAKHNHSISRIGYGASFLFLLLDGAKVCHNSWCKNAVDNKLIGRFSDPCLTVPLRNFLSWCTLYHAWISNHPVHCGDSDATRMLILMFSICVNLGRCGN